MTKIRDMTEDEQLKFNADCEHMNYIDRYTCPHCVYENAGVINQAFQALPRVLTCDRCNKEFLIWKNNIIVHCSGLL